MTQFTDDALISGVTHSDRRALARVISLIEDGNPRAQKVGAALYSRTGRASVIGVTGSPGAGKSTLVDSLAVGFRAEGKRVAVLAIDPTSPFSGGAILGDRIRMSKTVEDPDIFIRSMATRGALGGLARATFETVSVLDAAGYDVVLIETVGVGQVEVDVVRMVDTCLVVLVPGMGDTVQTFKAGILEIADIFVINKADRDGADLLHRDLRLLISLSEKRGGVWEPSILRTVATTGEGTAPLLADIGRHQGWLRASPEGAARRRTIVRETIKKLATDRFVAQLLARHGAELEALADDCVDRRRDPYTVVERLVSSLLQAVPPTG